MTTRIDISPEQLAIVQGILKDHLPKGTLAWAFGSRVTWTAKPFSDLDIALEGAAPLAPDVLIDLEEAFEASDLPWKVDVIDLHTVSPEFRAIVERQRVPADWALGSLKDLTTKIGSGATPRGGSATYQSRRSNFALIRSQSVYDRYFDKSSISFISDEQASQLRSAEVKPDDVLLNITGDGVTFGRCAIVPFEVLPACVNQHVAIIRADNENLVPSFLMSFLASPSIKPYIEGFNAGGSRRAITKGHIESFQIPLPPLWEQQSIGAVLASFDDKIELNRRMNETLEAMARAVFRDWFVDFGPTRRKAAGLTDPAAILGGLLPDPTQAAPLAALFPDRFGEDGLPEGWEERSIADDFDVEMGQSPPGSTYNEEGEGLPFFQGRRDFQFRFPEKRVYCSAPTRIAQADWTLISVRAPVGDINRAWEKCCIGRGVGAMMHKKGWASFTYYVGLHLQTELASYDKDGTVFGSINQKQLKGLSLIGTNSSAAKAFDDLIAPMDAMIRNNTAENQTLAATRDLLLPKLMSGEIRLTGAEGVV